VARSSAIYHARPRQGYRTSTARRPRTPAPCHPAMSMEPWWKLTTPRKEVREGRSFNPDEFAIALEQVVAGTAPENCQKPEQFFSRTCFTRALCDNSGLILPRLAVKTKNTAPVQTLVTQVGGGKTHMLTALWHLGTGSTAMAGYRGVATSRQRRRRRRSTCNPALNRATRFTGFEAVQRTDARQGLNPPALTSFCPANATWTKWHRNLPCPRLQPTGGRQSAATPR
jgi:hypothetical protein